MFYPSFFQNGSVKKSNLFKKVGFLVGLLILSRWIPHWPNVTALGAVSILAPFWLRNHPIALAIPLVALLISDLVIGFYPSMIFTYSAIFIISLAALSVSQKQNSESGNLRQGKPLQKQPLAEADPISLKRGLVWGTAASLVFYLITNGGVWLVGHLYPPTFSGLMLSYWNGLPFLVYEWLGNLAYLSLAIVMGHRLFFQPRKVSVRPS